MRCSILSVGSSSDLCSGSERVIGESGGRRSICHVGVGAVAKGASTTATQRGLSGEGGLAVLGENVGDIRIERINAVAGSRARSGVGREDGGREYGRAGGTWCFGCHGWVRFWSRYMSRSRAFKESEGCDSG